MALVPSSFLLLSNSPHPFFRLKKLWACGFDNVRCSFQPLLCFAMFCQVHILQKKDTFFCAFFCITSSCFETFVCSVLVSISLRFVGFLSCLSTLCFPHLLCQSHLPQLLQLALFNIPFLTLSVLLPAPVLFACHGLRRLPLLSRETFSLQIWLWGQWFETPKGCNVWLTCIPPSELEFTIYMWLMVST